MKLDLEKIKELYGENAIYDIREHMEDVTSNMYFLVSIGFNDVYGILEMNPYMFLCSPTIFKDKVNKLLDKLGFDYLEKLKNDISLWGDLDD
jgi:hypothetical protein